LQTSFSVDDVTFTLGSAKSVTSSELKCSLRLQCIKAKLQTSLSIDDVTFTLGSAKSATSSLKKNVVFDYTSLKCFCIFDIVNMSFSSAREELCPQVIR
jgi:hypothetical protein